LDLDFCLVGPGFLLGTVAVDVEGPGIAGSRCAPPTPPTCDAAETAVPGIANDVKTPPAAPDTPAPSPLLSSELELAIIIMGCKIQNARL